MKQQKAFTLIELLVVIVIIGILATISTATFDNYSQQARWTKGLAFSAQLERTIGAQLKGWWNFDEGTGSIIEGKDPTTVGDGTLYNTSWNTDTVFEKGASLDFNGTNSYAIVSNHDNYLNDEMTVSAWIKPRGITNPNGFFLSSLRFSGGGGSAHDGVIFSANKGDLSIRVRVFSAEYPFFDLVAPVPKFDEWMHVAFSIDGELAKLYVNGELKDEHTQPGRTFTNPDWTFTIGRYDYYSAYYYDGLIDDVRIYHDAIDFN